MMKTKRLYRNQFYYSALTFVLSITSLYSANSQEFVSPTFNSELTVSILNYKQMEPALKYEKLELGVILPKSLMDKVNRFVSNKAGIKINPYLEWELKVEAEFKHESSSELIRIDGFYFQPFVGKMKRNLPMPKNGHCYSDEEYASLGHYEPQRNDFPFRIRFSPPEIGEWKCKVIVTVEDENTSSDEFSFSVIESSSKGYISVGANQRYLQRDSNTFVPIGCNMAWPLTAMEFDPQFAINNIVGENKTVLPEQYRPKFVLPRVQRVYRKIIDQFADNGANSFRMIMYPSATDIEWEELGNYTNRLQMALELDSILMKAEDREMYIQWVMQTHYSFQQSNHAYYTRWCWDSKINGTPFCYSTIPGIEKDIDFFTNEIAIKYYKQRVRYILARWGYSTNISVFEIFSEINNVGTREADASAFYDANENWRLSRDWQWEMAEFIKSKYQGKMHLLTASYAGPVNAEDDVYSAEYFDLMGSNLYDYGAPSFSHNYWNHNVTERYLNETCESTEAYAFDCENGRPIQYTKPFMYGEYGVDPEGDCPNNYIETNRLFWQSLFSGLAGAYSWHAWYYNDNYEILGRMNEFISKYDLDREDWHPGASELMKYDNIKSWEYRKKYTKGMDARFTPGVFKSWKKRERKSDNTYLRSGDKKSAIGVLSNKTYNVGNTDTCFVWKELKGTPIEFQEKVDCSDEKMKLYGMEFGRYDIEYFLPSDLLNPIAASSDMGPRVKLKYTLDASEKGYIVLFVVKKRGE